MACHSSYTSYLYSALLSQLQLMRNLEMPHVTPNWVYDLPLHTSEFLFFMLLPIQIIQIFPARYLNPVP